MIFKCKICGGDLEISENMQIGTCQYCGSTMTIPRLDSERRENLYDRANHFRRNNEFDKAMAIYEMILNEDRTDAEAYWSIVLCKYGVEYIEDFETQKRILTCNRAQYTSILADEDYKQAIANATDEVKGFYETEAKLIDEIQRGILEIASKEDPFDVFICYKEFDENNKRTVDSVIAQEIFYELKEEGFRVFFSKITLEHKLGSEYEPYIFSALNSSKVMVALGTKEEYFQTVWVKNEWSRFLSMMKEGRQKVLIPAYKDMDPYDLPEEFSHLQALNMANIGFIQDLIRGIKKIVTPSVKSTHKDTSVSQMSAQIETSLEKAYLHLEYKEWEEAKKQLEYTLNLNPKLSGAYMGKLMAELKASEEKDLLKSKLPLTKYVNYQKAIRFADPEYKNILVKLNKDVENKIEEDRVQEFYNEASKLEQIALHKDDEEALALYGQVISALEDIGENLGTKEQKEACQNLYLKAENEMNRIRLKKAEEEQRQREQEEAKRKSRYKKIGAGAICLCLIALIAGGMFWSEKNSKNQELYEQGMALFEEEKYKEARVLFRQLEQYKDSEDKLNEAYYIEAKQMYEEGEYVTARRQFSKILEYGDAARLYALSDLKINVVSGSYQQGAYVNKNGTVTVFGSDYNTVLSEVKWDNIAGVSIGINTIVGLTTDKTAVASGTNVNGECEVSDWTDLVFITTGEVIEEDSKAFHESAKDFYTVGLKEDGNVVLAGSKEGNRDQVEQWEDIITLSNGNGFITGLKSDGTVVTTSETHKEVENWKDVVMVWSGRDIIGLKKDGSLLMTTNYFTEEDQKTVNGWKNIVSISTGFNENENWIVGITSDWQTYSIGTEIEWEDMLELPESKYFVMGISMDRLVDFHIDDYNKSKKMNIMYFNR